MRFRAAIDNRKVQLSLVVGSVALWTLAIALAPLSPANLSLTFVSVVMWSYVQLAMFIRNLYLRRGLKFLPYALPLFSVGLPGTVSGLAFTMSVGIGLLLGTTFQLINLRSLRQGLNVKLLSLMPKPTPEQAWSESMFFLAPAIAQEYLYRFAALVALSMLGVSPWASVLITALFFAGEHLFGLGTHTARSVVNITQWVIIGVILGTVSILTGSPFAAMITHLIINLPSAIRPHLRGENVSHRFPRRRSSCFSFRVCAGAVPQRLRSVPRRLPCGRFWKFHLRH
jgi:hypothetical protein